MKSLLLILFTFFFSVSFAQKPLKDVYLKRTLKQDGFQYEFKILDDDKHGIWFYSKEKFYFWYKAQGVRSTQGESSGTLLHGDFESFYENDQLHSKGNFQRGLKQGEWMSWREDGTLLTSEKWSNGEIKGEKRYNRHGDLFKVERTHGRNWHKDQADTILVKRKLLKQEFRAYRSDDGKLVRTEQWKKGALHGTVKYYSDGKLERTEKYKKGELISSSDDIKEAKTEKKIREKSDKEPKQKKERKSKKKAEKT